ncbi:uncharacterized protein LOC143466005 isoform X2 [Clavelina lepadiformis]|uniref:uncharacterized protein LOC143466005 isoform X2 n=1 Tax=Clavelina lepadiformis TaxID=159417 RepID=UPI004042F01B
MAGEDFGSTSYSALYASQIKVKNAKMELTRLEKELSQITDRMDSSGSNVAFLTSEEIELNKELQNVEKMTLSLTQELNDWDGSVQKPLKHYKDMKAGVDKFCAAQSNTQKLISHVESNTVEIEHLTQNLQNDVATTLSKNKQELQNIMEDNRDTIKSLQTQSKLIETGKKSLQSQLQQMTDENKELTKICEELINQRQSISSS